MIEIISGVYGYRNEKGRVEPKRPGDAPLALAADREAALVKRGVARYVHSEAPQPDEPELPSYDEAMSLKELQAVAAYYSVDASKMRTKREVVEAIDARLATGDDAEGGTPEDDEPDPDAPQLKPADPQA